MIGLFQSNKVDPMDRPKRQYGKWQPQDMKNALDEFRKEKVKLNECCRKYNIPKKTFIRHLRGEVKRSVGQDKQPLNGRETALPREAEEELVSEILYLEECLFGLTPNDIRKLAYDFMKANPHLKNPFSKTRETAGKKWYYGFMKRHPTLSLRQPENVSIARARGFNKENVYHFFDTLERIVDDNRIDALHIYNVDESGFGTVQKKSPKVVSARGKHQVGAVTSGERGINTTFVCCTSAAGHFVPPMIIFKRQRMHPALTNGAPPGCLVECSESGYINTELFVKWLKHFISHVKPTAENKVLLLLDGHSTHSKNLDAINIARENNVLLLQLPGHTTHRLQPLDVAVFKPFQLNYDAAVRNWLRTYPGQKVTQFSVAQLLAEAYGKSATLSNAASGFRASGVWPVDRNVFRDEDFATSDTIRNCEQPSENTSNEPDQNVGLSENVNQENQVVERENVSRGANEQQPGSNGSPIVVRFVELCPRPRPKLQPNLPSSSRQRGRPSQGAQKAQELTCSPYKRLLEEKRNPEKRKKQTKSKKTGKSSCRNDCRATSELSLNIVENVDVETVVDDWFCFLCNESIVEDMVKCCSCGKWAHESCAGNTKEDRRFVCDVCRA